MSNEHYFSANPQADKRVSVVRFEVGGKEILAKAASGTFSSGGLDKGTRVLLSLSNMFPNQGKILDLGCGWGPIALAIAQTKPMTSVWAIDINERSLELTRENAKDLGLENVLAISPEQLDKAARFDEIWSNPPIRIGKAKLHQLLETYIPMLAPGGRAMLVVQKQLGAESLMRWLADKFVGFDVKKIHSDKGYWVIQVVSPTLR